VLSFEALLFTISVAFILLAMAKERTELRHRTAAMVDPLTGISNRRAFLQEAATIAERHCSNPKPATVLLFDLDHFKSINDRFGHAVGDRVLEIFTATTGKAHWEPLIRARAIENQCFFVAPGQGGMHVTGRETHGHSMIVDPWGQILAQRDNGNGVVIAELKASQSERVRRILPALRHRIL